MQPIECAFVNQGMYHSTNLKLAQVKGFFSFVNGPTMTRSVGTRERRTADPSPNR